MKIRVNNEWLDMSDSDISLHWASMRFSDIFADAFTTDFELPMTARNMRLLDVWSVLSREGEPFGAMVQCSVVMQGKSSDAMLSIDGIAEGTIKATIYVATFPAALNGIVNEIVRDNDDTIIDYTARAIEVEQQRAANVNFTLYQTAGNILRPNVKLAYIMSQLSGATGVQLPVLSDNLRILATRQVVCPQNARQLLWMNWGDNGGEWRQTGQHISNVITEDVSVLMNRRARITLTAYVHTGIVTGSALALLQARGAGASTFTTIGTLQTGGSGSTMITTLSVGFDAGTEWRVVFSNWQGSAVLECEWSDYGIGSNDYDVPLNYDINADYSLPSWYSGDACFVYYGLMCNLPSFTCRELLSSLAWMLGKRLDVSPWSVELTDNFVSEEIDAQILSANFSCDKLGRITRIESAGGEVLVEKVLANDKLADNVTLHKSIFAKIPGVGAWNIAEIDLYSESDGEWKPADYNGGVVILERVQHSSGTIYLQPISPWSMLGVDTLARICEIEGVTTEDISECDFVYIEGHKYMLEEGDRDERTRLTTFTALLM